MVMGALKGSAEALERLLNILLSDEDFSLEGVRMSVEARRTLTGEENISLAVKAFIRPREETQTSEALESSVKALLDSLKKDGFRATCDMPTIELNVELKTITLPKL